MNHSLQAVKQRFGIIGTSKLLDAALDTALRVAATDLTVLITGESGVGKEVFSKIIHSFSARKHQPFIAVNCGAIPEGTINSELFGHEKGSFTSSVGDRKGYFETVNGGTIFLDEIGEMPLNTQPLLLRLLENLHASARPKPRKPMCVSSPQPMSIWWKTSQQADFGKIYTIV
jgi:transcriptional regulator with GAF, ATPase, and Fis domain